MLGRDHCNCTLSGQRNLKMFCMLRHISFRSVMLFLIDSSPASTRERSRISSIRASRRRLLLSTISIYFIRSSAESVSAMMRAKPSMAFSGVRISWLMLARKSDFMRLAFSALSVFSSYSASFLLATLSSYSAACRFALASAIFCNSVSFSLESILKYYFYPVKCIIRGKSSKKNSNNEPF